MAFISPDHKANTCTDFWTPLLEDVIALHHQNMKKKKSPETITDQTQAVITVILYSAYFQ